MIDQCNRKIDYVRISVTDRCNLRCIYCMPKDGVAHLEHEEILTYEEIVRLCRCFVRLGISKIKLTGGEPLVRKDIADLIWQIKGLDGIESVTLTSNGVMLKEQLPDLMKAGLDGINISLDTLNPETYERITGKYALHKVLDGIEAALMYEKLKVKVNCVPIMESDQEDIIKIAGMAKDTRLIVRFIEMMPIGLGKQFPPYSEDKIIKILEEVYGPFQLYKTSLGNGPAHYYSVPGFEGKIGFISALSHKFCDECNRVRLTSDGFLKTCLQYRKGTNLKPLLRGKEEDNALEQVIRQTIYDKPFGHNFMQDNHQESQEHNHMSSIGG